jgi:UDP-N-acetylmuramoyl-tripeptide--D-alanyl-D-alanine ligase
MNLTIAQVVEYSKANILTEACDTTLMVSDICWDTRAMADVTNVFANDEALRKPETAKDPETANVPTGVLFIAFKGERTDGNDYIIEAISKGAVVVLAGRDLNAEEYALAKQRGTCVLRSDDTVASLQQLAASYRKLLESNTHFTTIGITGSSGKTTTKDLVAAVLKTTYATVATQGNHNNEIGLPITILSAKMADDNVSESTQMLVTEMGMQGLGEISLLANIAKPKIGVLTNIGVAHCELLGSRENIARAKSELILALPDHSEIGRASCRERVCDSV